MTTLVEDPVAAPLLVHAPRLSEAEVRLRLAVNALAVAIHRGDRQALPRPAAPFWLERPRPVPGGPLAAELESLEAARLELAWAHRRAPRDGGPILPLERRLAAVEARLEAARSELALVRTGGHTASGPHRARLPAAGGLTRDGPLALEPCLLLVSVPPRDWAALEPWRHGRARPTLRRGPYRLRPDGRLEGNEDGETLEAFRRAVTGEAAGGR